MSTELAEVNDFCKLTYVPTDFQRKIKIRLWKSLDGDLTVRAEELSHSELARRAGTSSVKKWLTNPEFKAWLLDKRTDEFESQVEYLCDLTLIKLENILTSEKSSAKDIINACKLIMEVSGRLAQHKQKKEFIDGAISKMSEAQLKDFLEQSGIKVKGELQPVAIEAEYESP